MSEKTWLALEFSQLYPIEILKIELEKLQMRQDQKCGGKLKDASLGSSQNFDELRLVGSEKFPYGKDS